MKKQSVLITNANAEVSVANADGVLEDTVNVMRDAKPLAGEVPGQYARYSSLITKALVYAIEG